MIGVVTIPCPQCGERFEATAEVLARRANQPVRFACGHIIVLRSRNLRNPIRPPSWRMLGGSFLGGACFFLGLAIWAVGAVAGNRDSRWASVGPVIAFLPGPAVLVCLALLSIVFVLRDLIWRCTKRGRNIEKTSAT